jgi:hypothetical protein
MLPVCFYAASVDFLDCYVVAIEEGRWRILGDVVHR